MFSPELFNGGAGGETVFGVFLPFWFARQSFCDSSTYTRLEIQIGFFGRNLHLQIDYTWKLYFSSLLQGS